MNVYVQEQLLIYDVNQEENKTLIGSFRYFTFDLSQCNLIQQIIIL